MIAPLLRLAATTAAGRAVRSAATDATNRLMLIFGAALGGAVAVFCLSRAAVTLLERHMDPAEAWAVLGAFYGVMGGVSYLAATRRRRG
jgi:ABC-type arginine/histidine transport system permease subunit